MGLDGVVAALGFFIAAVAMLSFPVYGWVRDKRRRGERVKIPALVSVLVLGAIGVLTLALLVMAKSILGAR